MGRKVRLMHTANLRQPAAEVTVRRIDHGGWDLAQAVGLVKAGYSVEHVEGLTRYPARLLRRLSGSLRPL